MKFFYLIYSEHSMKPLTTGGRLAFSLPNGIKDGQEEISILMRRLEEGGVAVTTSTNKRGLKFNL